MAYKHAQQTLYKALKSRGIDREVEEEGEGKGKEIYLKLDSNLPIHGNGIEPLTTQRVRMMFRELARTHNLSGINLDAINEARTFSQLTTILANSTPHSEDRGIQHEAALAYVDFPLKPKSQTAQPDGYLTKIKVGVPATRPGHPIGPLEEADFRALEEVGLIRKD